LEETNCNLCGSNDTEPVYAEKDRLMKLPGSFQLVRCRQCGLLYINPRPTFEEMGRFYPDDYLPYKVTRENASSSVAHLDHSYGYWKRARLIHAHYPQGGRILDVGCATGDFLHMMERVGNWEVHGVEVDSGAASSARKVYGLDVKDGQLTDVHYPGAHFDVITIWDVLEHVHDPSAYLADMHRILRPGGLAIVRVPNVETWDARLFGEHWVGLDAPRHLYIFSAQTLEVFLEKAGFTVQKMRSVMLGYLPFALSVQFWLEESLSDGRLRMALLKLNHSWIPRLLTRPFFTLLGYANHPTFAVAAFATKGRRNGQ